MGVANYDCVVVGAGAAGTSAAIALAKADFSVLVLEAAPFPGAENWSGCVYFTESLAAPELLGPEGVEELAWERRLVERGIFSTNGHSSAGITYRDPAAFRHCYTVLRPIFDHHLAQVARRGGATVLSETTAESLIRERGRVIGVSTSRGPVYADLVFLAEGDASHLITKEGYERETPGRQQPHFLQGVKQVIDMPPGAIEEIFGVGAQDGVAYEMLLRNGTLRGRPTALNMGGFLYTNRSSISLGFVLPLRHLHDGFGGDPHVLMEWLRGLPEIRRWTRGGVPGVFGAKLIRGGGVRDIPHLVDHGLAVGGAASAIGVDFPYPNFTGPASGMGLLLARAATAIRQHGGSFTLDELRRHYLEPLQKTHWWADVHHLRRWPGYVEKTRFFFGPNIDALHGTLYLWTRPGVAGWRRWCGSARLLRRVLPAASWRGWLADTRQMVRALGIPDLTAGRPVGRLLLDGWVNAGRDLLGRKRPDVDPTGELRFHYSVAGGQEPVAALPAPVIGWGRRLAPVLSCAAREIYRNEPVPLPRKLTSVLRLLAKQVNLLDLLVLFAVAVALAATALAQGAVDRLRRLLRRAPRARADGAMADRWLAATQAAAEMAPGPRRAGVPSADPPAALQTWEDKLGRLTYETTRESHIKLFWPQSLADRGRIAEAGLWHVCPAQVYECHPGPAGQVRLVVNHENCIKCESCWRASDLVDWGRNGGHRFVYRVLSPVVQRLLAGLDRALERRLPPPKAADWWAGPLRRLAQRAASAGGNGQYACELIELERLGDKIEAKLRELERSLGDEPRTIDEARKRWLETIATYAKQLVEAVTSTVREGPLARATTPALADVQAALAEAAGALESKIADVTRFAYDRNFFWSVADGRQIIGHQLEGLRRITWVLRGHFAPAPAEPDPSARWLEAERAADRLAGFAGEACRVLDGAFDRFAWRDLERGTPLTAAQAGVLRSLSARIPRAVRRAVAEDAASGGDGRDRAHPPRESSVPAAAALPAGSGATAPAGFAATLGLGAERRALLSELGRRDPSLAYMLASHLWSRDLLAALGGPEFRELVERLGDGSQMAAFAYDGWVEFDRDDEGVRLRGQKIYAASAAADWFVLVADDQLIALRRGTPGLRIEPQGALGLRGAAPATLVLDRVELPATRCRVVREDFERLWTVLTAADLTATACGMADRLQARAVEQATSRVQFPGLFSDEDFRDTIGKFGAVKKMIAQIGARRYLIETLLYNFCPAGWSEPDVQRALELKLAATEALGTARGSIAYNVTQIFGGLGYSEEDYLAKYYRDAATLRMLGVPNARAADAIGHELMERWTAGERALEGIAEPALYDTAAQRKAMQRELDAVRRLRHDIEAALARWNDTLTRDPQARSLSDSVADALGRRQAELCAAEAILLRTHARLEAGLPAELEIELVRSWLDDVTDAVREWLDAIADLDAQISLPFLLPREPRSRPAVSYRDLLAAAPAYQTGDFLVKPFDPASPRYVPEMVRCDPALDRYDRELDQLFRVHYREKSFDGGSYERHVERQHRLDPEDFELFRAHGFFRMYIPRELGGRGASKAEYNLLIKNLIASGDVGQALTVQANSSIGTVPVLLALGKDLPRAKRELADYAAAERERSDLAVELERARGAAGSGSAAEQRETLARVRRSVERLIGGRVALRALYHDFLTALEHAAASAAAAEPADAASHLAAAREAFASGTDRIAWLAEELDRRVQALTQFQQWIAAGQMTAFALTEPSAGSDTARVATRAVPRSVALTAEPDGSYRFTPAAGAAPRRLIDARRIAFQPDGAYYRWSDAHEPALIRFDEYDYEADDSDRPRYYMAGPVKVPFHDIAQVRERDGRPHYEYWELNGAKMWITNARMCGVMVLYAKTAQGVTGFYVDRHAEGLLVGKNEEKMGQGASVTNELGLQAVRVPLENVVGIEGRGQVNALESLNAGRSGLTTSTTTSMDDLIARAERFAHERYGQIPWGVRHRLEEMAIIRYACESIAYELTGRADAPGTLSLRIEPAIGKMLASESLLRVIELCEEIYGLEGHTAIYNLEKHKRDGRIITVYEGTNEVQRSVILKDLVREVAERRTAAPPRRPAAPASPPPPGSDKLRGPRETLEEMKRSLAERISEAFASFGDEVLNNPNMQSVFFGLSDAAAWIKAADSSIARAEWVLANLTDPADAAYRDWCLRITRRAVAAMRRKTRLRLADLADSLAALRQGLYPPEVRAASLMMRAESRPAPWRGAGTAHSITRPVQIFVLVDLEPSVSPQPALDRGGWAEAYYRLDTADAGAVALARQIAAASSAPVRVIAAGVGPRRSAKILEEALAAGADEALLVLSDGTPRTIEATARALARTIESERAAPDLILAREASGDAAAGMLGALVASELGVRHLPRACAIEVRCTEDEAAARVWSGEAAEVEEVALPALVGVRAPNGPEPFAIRDFLASLDRPIRSVPWPPDLPAPAVELRPVAAATGRTGPSLTPRSVSASQAADILCSTMGLGTSDGAADESGSFEGALHEATRWEPPAPGAALVIAVAGPQGRLRPADRRAVRVASALARREDRPLDALVFVGGDEPAQRRAAAELVQAGAGRVVLALTHPQPSAARAAEFWCRLLIDYWPPQADWSAVVAGPWAEPALARLAAGRGDLAFRISELSAAGARVCVRTPRAAGKIDAVRELPDTRPLWASVAESADCDMPPRVASNSPHVERWPIDAAASPSRRELMELLQGVREQAGVPRLSDAAFIIDVGFGIANRDGFDAIVPPLQAALHEIGIERVTVGASRKVTDELKILPAAQQIGQTGQSVNPTVLLAIGVSGAPQHVNYIGTGATIIAFNRDAEAPIMTLNQRQARPRVFPVVGDLFQTVPAFIAALRQLEGLASPPADRPLSLQRVGSRV
jgi:electron transfer flavoprotein-quinone oxidoreductase